ncbi:MAG: terminase small subunit [Fretibacterium sp.]|nr:terminase small subunit [Fretibacterium sp.]
MKGEKLTAKEEEFCRQYVVLRNGARAAAAAGYNEKRARQTAHELRTKRYIQERLAELEKEWMTDSEISREQIIAELKAVAFSNIQDDFLPTDADPQQYLPYGEEVIRALPARPRHVTAAIKSVNIDGKGNVNITRYDKVAALSKLAEILGLTNPMDMNVNVSIADGLSEAKARLAAFEGTA